MVHTGRVAAGSLIGAALAALAAPLLKPLFDPPTGGVGALTVHGYPKGWDYAVVALLVVGAALGGIAVGKQKAESRKQKEATNPISAFCLLLSAFAIFLAMLVIHDYPYQHMDPFHEGEHLTPAYLFEQGARPYGDVFLLHGLGVDGGLDALVLGDELTPLRTRRLQTVLDAATLALIAFIAAEVTATGWGFAAAVLLSLCGVAAFWLPVFPYFRLAPILLATLALLRYERTRRNAWLFVAFASGTLGLLWSLDVGTYTLAGVVVAAVILRPPLRSALPLAALALALPLLVLRGNVAQFVIDSFVIIPSAIDAVWSLPAPAPFTAAGVRYYAPPIFYGFLIALAIRRRDPRIAILAILSILLFRTASGRVSWSHTRFAVPLLGIAFVMLLEQLKSRVAIAILALGALAYFEVPQNLAAGAKQLAAWPSRQRHEGLVRHPLARGIYTTADNATTLLTLKNYIDSLGDGTILDFTNERALYAMLERKPPVRCFDIPMLSSPRLLDEAMASLEAHPPIAVILGGEPAVAVFDGVSNRDRVPRLAQWIDAHYPKRTEIGRFTVATR